jgi:hypothetical protein
MSTFCFWEIKQPTHTHTSEHARVLHNNNKKNKTQLEDLKTPTPRTCRTFTVLLIAKKILAARGMTYSLNFFYQLNWRTACSLFSRKKFFWTYTHLHTSGLFLIKKITHTYDYRYFSFLFSSSFSLSPLLQNFNKKINDPYGLYTT